MNGPAVGLERQVGNRGSTVDGVVRFLREGIIERRFAPGQRLIEAEITGELGVSRGPVREAFRRLAAEGVIELVPNRGAIVRRLSFKETQELFQIRTELEALAARLAAANAADPETRARFEAATRHIWSEEPRLSAAAYNDENKRFHDAVFAASGNGQLVQLSRQLQLPLIMFQLSGVLEAEQLAASVAEHREIAAAILAGDGGAAAEGIRRHLERASAVTRRMPAATFRP